MDFHKVSIKGLTLTVLAVLAVGSIGFSLFGAKHFSQTALESQEKAVSRMVHIAALQSMEVMHARSVDMVQTFEKGLRRVVKTMQKTLVTQPQSQQL